MLRRAFLAALLALSLGAARAEEAWERFFELSFGDLRAEAEEAKKDGKQALLVMYHFGECPYCQRMKRDVLSQPQVKAYYARHFRAIGIDTRGSQEVTDFDGRKLPENRYAREAGVRATPTFRFYGADGRLLAEHRGGIATPAEFILLGEYVAGGAYRGATFAEFKQSRQKRGS
jgi:thioredoxin-related protein